MTESSENFEVMTHCPVCESQEIAPFRKTTFDIHTLGKEDVKITDSAYGKVWDLSRCSRCTHVFANPRPTPGFIFSLYSQIEDPLYEEEASGRAQNFKRILRRLEELRPQKGHLFDVGAATGILLDLARGRGWEPDGVEPSAWAVEIASQKYGLSLRTGDFTDVDIPRGRYAAVTLVDIIEHLTHPEAALQKSHTLLSPDGILCLVTPDIGSRAARLFKHKWWHFRPAHLSYFSRHSLQTLLTRCGFEIVKVRRYNWTFSAHYLLSRLGPLKIFLKNAHLASVWKKIPIKLALGDSFEVYARKKET
jgi:2-polyprenyl-3-methyl-5-hydroxy-6-metoxy-1,4-benzoquinol methylase